MLVSGIFSPDIGHSAWQNLQYIGAEGLAQIQQAEIGCGGLGLLNLMVCQGGCCYQDANQCQSGERFHSSRFKFMNLKSP
jgi:hypothetical protein